MIQIEYKDLLGKEYIHNGRGPVAYDCYGIVMEVFKRYGILIKDYGNICDRTEKNLNDVIWSYAEDWQEISKPEIPCLVGFWLFHPEWLCHIGVVVDDDKFLHILQSKGAQVGIERLSISTWSKRILGYYRWAPK